MTQPPLEAKQYVLEIYDTERRSSSDCIVVYRSTTPFMGVHAGDLIYSNEYGLVPDVYSLRVVEVEHIFTDLLHKLMIYVKPAE